MAKEDVVTRVRDDVLRKHGAEAVTPFVSAADALRAGGHAEAVRRLLLLVLETRLGAEGRSWFEKAISRFSTAELEALMPRAARASTVAELEQ